MSAVLDFEAKCEHGWIGSPSRCRKCRSEARKASRVGIPDGRKNVILTEDGRTCLKCGQSKLWDEFAKDVRGFNQKTADCRDCRRVKHREAYKNNPAVRRSGGLKNRPDKVMKLYGITYEEAVQTLANQFGRCGNTGCGKEISFEAKGNTREKAVIDHCHVSGKFRAILCSKCNLDLGMLETDEQRFLGLMAYKAKYNHKEKE